MTYFTSHRPSVQTIIYPKGDINCRHQNVTTRRNSRWRESRCSLCGRTTVTIVR